MTAQCTPSLSQSHIKLGADLKPHRVLFLLTKKTIPASGATKLNMSKFKLTPTVAAAPTIGPRQKAAPKIFIVIVSFLLRLIE